MVERLFLTVPRGCLQFVIVVFPDHTHLLFLAQMITNYICLVMINWTVASENCDKGYFQVLRYRKFSQNI